VASDVRKKHAKYNRYISSNAVIIRILVNTPTKVKKIFMAVKGLNGDLCCMWDRLFWFQLAPKRKITEIMYILRLRK
jgi:hypothetical protein